MRKIKFVVVGMMIFLMLGSISSLAEEEEIMYDLVELETLEDHGEYRFSFKIKPIICYNPVQNWVFGSQVFLSGLAGEDMLTGFLGYSFSKKSANIGLDYMYAHGSNYYYGDIFDIVEYKGIFGNEPYWQRSQGMNLGIMHEKYLLDGFYYVDLKVGYSNLEPANSPGGYVFDSGKDIRIMPTIIGSYNDFLGSLQISYGVPLESTDFDYIKVNTFLEKYFDISKTDQLILSTEIGTLRGNYPAQQRFYLGSSDMNITPNFKNKMLGFLNTYIDGLLMIPHVSLDGFEDNAFSGENMYSAKIEYQKNLFSYDIVNLFGKAYLVSGNAWTGDIAEGFERPKTAVGIGLYLGFGDINQMNDDIGFGINLARGLNEKNAFTVGFEIGGIFEYFTLDDFK